MFPPCGEKNNHFLCKHIPRQKWLCLLSTIRRQTFMRSALGRLDFSWTFSTWGGKDPEGLDSSRRPPGDSRHLVCWYVAQSIRTCCEANSILISSRSHFLPEHVFTSSLGFSLTHSSCLFPHPFLDTKNMFVTLRCQNGHNGHFCFVHGTNTL